MHPVLVADIERKVYPLDQGHIADTLGAMDSMACRETTVCRDKWGEQ